MLFYAWVCSDDTYEVCHVATKLSATQSSVYADGWGTHDASLAVDGSRRAILSQLSCSHSLMETNPWWVVELGIPLTVTGVFFTNRDHTGAFIVRYLR